MGSGLLFFPGATNQPINYKANTYPFRQDSHFLYYFGLPTEGYSGIIDVDAGISYLVGDDPSMEDIVWIGPQPAIVDLAASIGAEKVLSISKLESFLTGKPVQYLPVYHADRIFTLSRLLNKSTDEVKSGFSNSLVRAVIAQRSVKSSEEIEQMEEAHVITAKIHEKIRTTIREGLYESDLRGLSEGIAFANQGRLAYQAICTTQGQTLHMNEYHRKLSDGQLLLCDIGAENAMHYAADITRSYPVSPQFTTRQAEIYDIVLNAEESAIAAVKPGVAYRDIHFLAARVVTEGLKAIGLMKGDTDESLAAGAHALFFPHGLGHMIGLDVHDMEDLGEDLVGYSDSIQRSTQFGTAYLRLGKVLEQGYTLTVEPGIYFIPELIDLWKAEGKNSAFIAYEKLDAYKGFSGIRIEDNVLVTESACKVLGPGIAKSRIDIEKK